MADPVSSPAPSSSSSVIGSSVVIVSTVSDGSMQMSTAVIIYSDSVTTDIVTSTHFYTPSSTAFASDTPTAHNAYNENGLSPAAKAVVGAGAAVVLFTALVFSCWLIFYCRRRRKRGLRAPIAVSDRYSPIPSLPAIGPSYVPGRRYSELPSSTSPKQTFSWTNSSVSNCQSQSLTEESEYLAPVSEEGYHPAPSQPAQDPYQRTIMHDGYWPNAQELPTQLPSSSQTVIERLQLQNVHGRTIVPPGKWPPEPRRTYT